MGSIRNSIDQGKKVSSDTLYAKGKVAHEKWGLWIKQYMGDVPYGMVCIRIGVESSSNQNAGPSSDGEVGLLQVWMGRGWKKRGDYVQPGQTGATCTSIKKDFDPWDPIQNLWCGMLGWNKRARTLKTSSVLGVGDLFPSSDDQYWGCVNLGMSIGNGALSWLLKKSGARPGSALTDLARWVDKTGDSLGQYNTRTSSGKLRFGSQSPALVGYRVMKAEGAYMKAAKKLSGLTTSGFGRTSIPIGGGNYPMPSGGSGGLIPLLILGGAAWYLWQRR